MKIDNNIFDATETYFGELNSGAIFYREGYRVPYMKLDTKYRIEYTDTSPFLFDANAVSLNDSTLKSFTDDMCVVPLNVKLACAD